MALLIDDSCPISFQVKMNGQNYRLGHNTYSFTNGAHVFSEHARLNWANHGTTLIASFIDTQENFAEDEYASIFTKMTLSLDNNKLIGHITQSPLDGQDENETSSEKVSCSLEKLNTN